MRSIFFFKCNILLQKITFKVVLQHSIGTITLWFNLLKFIKTYLAYDLSWVILFNLCLRRMFLLLLDGILVYMSIKFMWTKVWFGWFKFNVCMYVLSILVIFCPVSLSTVESGLLKFPTYSVLFSRLSLKFVSICLIYFRCSNLGEYLIE